MAQIKVTMILTVDDLDDEAREQLAEDAGSDLDDIGTVSDYDARDIADTLQALAIEDIADELMAGSDVPGKITAVEILDAQFV